MLLSEGVDGGVVEDVWDVVCCVEVGVKRIDFVGRGAVDVRVVDVVVCFGFVCGIVCWVVVCGCEEW